MRTIYVPKMRGKCTLVVDDEGKYKNARKFGGKLYSFHDRYYVWENAYREVAFLRKWYLVRVVKLKRYGGFSYDIYKRWRE